MRKFKILTALVLILCFGAHMVACTNTAEGPTTNETTTNVNADETKETTTKDETTKSTERETEYRFKGEKWIVLESKFELFDNLVIEPGDVISVNDYVFDTSVDADATRGGYIRRLILVTESENSDELMNEITSKYTLPGDSSIYIPYDDNYSFKYIGDKKIIFKFVEYDNGNAIFDVYKE